MIGTLKRAVGRTTHDFRECRRCGTTLDSLTVRCPACGSRDVARYEIE